MIDKIVHLIRGYGCTNAKIIEPKYNEIVPSINHVELTEKIISLEEIQLKMQGKLSKIEKKLYKELSEKEKIPISTCFEVFENLIYLSKFHVIICI